MKIKKSFFLGCADAIANNETTTKATSVESMPHVILVEPGVLFPRLFYYYYTTLYTLNKERTRITALIIYFFVVVVVVVWYFSIFEKCLEETCDREKHGSPIYFFFLPLFARYYYYFLALLFAVQPRQQKRFSMFNDSSFSSTILGKLVNKTNKSNLK